MVAVESNVRALPQRHMAKAVKQRRDNEKTDPPLLGPDEMQLYSYYSPGLKAGEYTIEAVQEISASTAADGKSIQKLRVTNVRGDAPDTLAPQVFEVVVPRFTMDTDIVNSYYPPDGHQDEGRILPHIVFNDPHYPWEIDAGTKDNMSGQIDGKRNMVPWVGLVVFDPEELRLDLDELKDLKIPGITDPNKQNMKGTFTLKVQDYFNVLATESRISFAKALGDKSPMLGEFQKSKESAEVIFPKKELFIKLFEDPESLKYLSHVRNINTVGFPDAGVEEVGLFSIVVSSRTGQFDIQTPKTQICHLVSIEHVDSTVIDVKDWLLNPSGSNRIGMFSLYSWVYTALPPNPINFIDTIRDLIEEHQMLRADDSMLSKLKARSESGIGDKAQNETAKLLYERLRAGYVPARWRTETGEVSAAVNRGPFVLQPVPNPPTADLPDCSNTSKEFQIYDTTTGLMDLSYSSAWQLGKMLAISDMAFSSALMRLRFTFVNSSSSLTRKSLNNLDSETKLVSNLGTLTSRLGGVAGGQPGAPQRLVEQSPTNPTVDMRNNQTILSKYQGYLDTGIAQHSSAGGEIYNEFNKIAPNNNDWVIVHSWLADKLFLADIPPQYIIPDPSFVPSEALRYFYVDDFWLDCLIDGALSVANHLDRDDDLVRVKIKERFNTYLRSVVPGAGIKPQIPCYGFILRSLLVKTMPDLRITVKWKAPEPEGKERQSVCRYTRYDDTTIFCLLDRMPEELESITLAQPPHQQRFSLGSSLNKDKLQFVLRTLYTDLNKAPKEPKPEWPDLKTLPDDDPQAGNTRNWFDWNSRCIKLRSMASDINKLIQNSGYVDTVPNSCELGLELNDPSYYFQIFPPKTGSPPARDRQLYINKKANQDKIPISQRVPETSSKPPPKPTDNKPKPPDPVKPTPIKPATPSDLPSDLPMPNKQPRIIPLPQRLLDQRKPPVGAPLNMFEQFQLAVYPDYASYPKPRTNIGYDAQSYVPTQNLYLFDLIFSLRKKAIYSNSSYELLDIQIDIPHDRPGNPRDIKPEQEPLLLSNYEGPGVSMSGNQRFIPFLYMAKEHLTVRLIPRTAADDYRMKLNDRKTQDLGFRLAEAPIAPLRAPKFIPVANVGSSWRGVVTVTKIERYATAKGPWPITTVYEVVKNGIRDEADKALDK